MGSFSPFSPLGRGFGAALNEGHLLILFVDLTRRSPKVARRGLSGLCFWTAREPRGCCAGRSARGESLDVSEATYEARRERSHGVVSSLSGRERPR